MESILKVYGASLINSDANVGDRRRHFLGSAPKARQREGKAHQKKDAIFDDENSLGSRSRTCRIRTGGDQLLRPIHRR